MLAVLAWDPGLGGLDPGQIDGRSQNQLERHARGPWLHRQRRRRRTRPRLRRWAPWCPGPRHRDGVSRVIGMGVSHDFGIAEPTIRRHLMLVHVEASPGHHRCPVGFVGERGRPHLRCLPGLDQPVDGPLPRRGRGGVRAPITRPKTSPGSTSAVVVERILALRDDLTTRGHDAGADTISWHLAHRHGHQVPRSTIHRILTRHGRIPRHD